MKQRATVTDIGTSESRDPLDTLADACRILHAQGHMASLAGQITWRDTAGRGYWTPALATHFARASAASMLLVDDELHVLEGNGRPNPAVRFHAWVYRHRPDVRAIVHTHPRHVSALSMLGVPLPVAHMDACMFHDDCGFLAQWPGVPIDDEEGRIITEALGSRRSALLVNHGYICACASVEESVYMAVSMESAAEMALLAMSAGTIQPVRADLAQAAHDFLLQPSIVKATFAYWRELAGV
ncbi:aldolase [Paraburkholderia sp. D15]|uniref:aldolase n=1 Tax=Paraburkholderia sp. D15 TaxID=2880218 RepID=UPI002478596B|nr:aldolase [Paraburkholderia sp. D15]WGS52379.1 aldolase [Paraburkholderia sp. D15]WKF62219.1 4-hydroxy-3-prenylphenylpyruvate oxygenase/4-hydroxy-3-prenylbenzoate synthase [Paraburkholderia busanensis]